MSRAPINLSGSTDKVVEFFGYCISSILYQRGIYPQEDFSKVKKYGLTLFVTANADLKKYLSSTLKQLTGWLNAKSAKKLVLVISSVEPKEVVERWVFHVQGGGAATADANEDMQSECASLMRQIFASVTFLPLIDTPCTFDLLVYADINTDVPLAWEESNPRYIAQPEGVKLRSVDTGLHQVDVDVQYKHDA